MEICISQQSSHDEGLSPLNIIKIIIIKHRTLSIVFRASKPKEVNHLRTAPFLDIWALFYHHGNGDAAAAAHPRYLKVAVEVNIPILTNIQYLWIKGDDSSRLKETYHICSLLWLFSHALSLKWCKKIHLSPCSFLNCSSLQMTNFHDF